MSETRWTLLFLVATVVLIAHAIALGAGATEAGLAWRQPSLVLAQSDADAAARKAAEEAERAREAREKEAERERAARKKEQDAEREAREKRPGSRRGRMPVR